MPLLGDVRQQMIIRILQTVAGVVLIVVGLFLWFALAFNGSVGEDFVNYSFFTSAALMIAFGASKIANTKYSISIFLGMGSVILYLPMIWQRFNFSYTNVSDGIYFDFWVVAILLLSLLLKPRIP